MFRNRHLNFGYLLVILVAFAIAITASSKLAYAGPGGPNGALSIRIDAALGSIVDAVGVGLVPDGSTNPNVPVPEAAQNHPKPLKIKEVIPCTILIYDGSDCIIFYIGGKQYTYCP